MKVLLSLFTNKIVKMFSQYNTALFPALNCYNSWDHSYCTEMQKAALLMNAIYPFKSPNLHITVSGILIERDCFKMFELLRIWSISQYLANPFSHCKPWLITWSTIVSLILSDMRLCPWPLLPLPLFCLCTLPPCILPPLLSLVYWPWSFPVYKKCFCFSWKHFWNVRAFDKCMLFTYSVIRVSKHRKSITTGSRKSLTSSGYSWR